MQKISIEQRIDQIVKTDPRYHKDAYEFVRDALDFTIKQHKKKNAGVKEQHISARELLAGIRVFALEQFGPLAYTVLTSWNVKSCEDFGELVYNMVSVRILKTNEEDSKENFKDGYDFHEAFVIPFEPLHAAGRLRAPTKTSRSSQKRVS
jgi:uncharacterized repeat protein (TIGR04138 family)